MRRPYLHEFPQILEIERLSFGDWLKWEIEIYVDMLIDGGECWVDVEGLGSDKIVGSVWIAPDLEDESAMEITSVSVTPEARRKGHGRRLVELAILRSKLLSKDSVALHVRQDNVVAKSLYEKLGFKFVRSIEGYYRDKATGERYELKLR